MHRPARHGLLIATGIVIAVLGIALAAGGAWLIALRGSWYYLIAGLAMLACGVQLARGRVSSLWIYAALVLGTLAWALWEAGLDWWPLAARGDVLFVLGLFLLTPWIRRRLDPPNPDAGALLSPSAPVRQGRVALAVALGLFLAAGVASWFVDLHKIEGAFADEAPAPVSGGAVAKEEWTAYGGTGYGQRYSALTQITPENVDRLEQAWVYRTGDVRGREGDPEETTFQVTPLKIGNRLFLCTPHQSVIALDATSGKELWRYDPHVQDRLALQHLTCRGLSYYPGDGLAAGSAASAGVATGMEGGGAAPAAGGDGPLGAGPSSAPFAGPGQPVAAKDGKTSPECPTKLFMPTADGRIIALNPEDGGVCADFGGGTGQINLWRNMPNVKPGSYYSTSPVVVARGLIIVGGTVLDNVSVNEASGVIRAFDIRTGRLVWNWDSGNPEDTAPIAEGRTYTANSPNSWSISSVDESLGMIYVPLGNQPPDQWGGNRSEGAERYSSSVVALDLATGKVRWSFQTVHHDLWDYDVPAQPSLVDLTMGGATVPVLVQPTKQGEVYVLDRRTGRPVLPVSEKPAPQGAARGDRTAATQPVSALSYDPPPLTGADMWGATMFDQLACRIMFHRLRYEGRYTPPSTQGSLIYPGNFGVFNWGGIAVDPQRQVAFTTPTYLAFVSQLVPRKDDTTLYVQGGERPNDSLPSLNENFGAPFAVKLSAFTSLLGLPCQAPPWGYVAGADLRTGQVVWKHKNGTVRDSSPLPLPFRMGVPNLGGPVMTAGGVAFLSGTLDYYVRAYDVRNGRQLWKSRLPAGGQATPMTYAGADGRQYVLVVAGGHGSLGTKAGDYVIAYALPGQGS